VIGSLLECSFFLFLPKTIIRNTISTLLELLLERPRAELVFRAYIKESLVQPSATLLSALGLLAAVSSIFMLASPVRVQVET
jgi:hypothetical protein